MAAIFQLRRGTSDVILVDGELYLHNGSGSIQFGSGSNNYTLLPLNTPAYGDINLSGSISASGDVRIGGNIYLGDNLANDSVNVNSPFSGSIIPSGSNTFDLGSSTTVYRNIYSNRVSASFFTGSLNGTVNGIDVTNFSTSVDGRLDVIESKYATTGSNIFVGNQTISGSLIVSGSNIQFSGSNIEFTRDWPEVGSESHFLRLEPFTSSTGRYYQGLGIGVEHWDDGTGTYEHSLLIHSFDDDTLQNYGAELNVGPYRTHMRVYPSGSNGSLSNISVQELSNGKSQALVYGDYVHIGAFTGQEILIGNTGSLITITGSNMLFDTPLTSSHPIVATLFSGSISGIGNVTEFSSSISDKFVTISNVTSSFDSRLDRLEESTQSLNDYTQSLKSAIDVTGGDTRILGNLIVDGTQTSLNTTNTFIEDKSITLASGSTNSSIADGAGFNIAGANVSMSWEDGNQRLYFNTNLGIQGSISSSTIVGLNGVSVNVYSASVDSRLTNSEILSASILGHIYDINLKTGSFETKFTTIQSLTASYDIHTASLNIYTQSVNGHILDLNSWTASQNEKDIVISNITSSYNSFTGSATASIVELFWTASNHEIRIDSLETKATTVESYTASIDSKFVKIESITASYNSVTASFNQFTSSTYTTFSTSVDLRLDELEYTASILTPEGQAETFNAYNSFTASANSRLSNLEIKSASVDVSITSLNAFTTSQENLNLTFATTGSNTFIGTQTISGSTYITGDLIVFGSSSLQNVTASAVSIGTNTVILNNDTPSVRFGGISVADSGSGAGASGSLFWDSVNNNWIYQHPSGGVESAMSAILISGPLNTGSLGDEAHITPGRIMVATGDDHIGDSNIYHNETITAFAGNVEVTGSTTLGTANITTLNAGNGVVSGSSQITLSSTTGYSTFSSSLNNRFTEIENYTSSLKSALSVNGNDLVVAGNLTVLGDAVTLNVGNLSVEDKTITLASGSPDSISSDGAGLYISGADASILWNHSNTRLDINKSIYVSGDINTLGSITGSIAATNGVVSGSSQVSYVGLSNIPSGIISSSAQIDALFDIDGLVSGSSQISYVDLSNIPAGIISSSAQIDALFNIDGLVSGSSQITLSSTTGGSTTSDVQFGSLGIGTAASGVSGEIRATGDIVAFYSSDERLKENIQPIQNALSKVESISGNTYDWKEGFEKIHSHKGNDLGVIAQEVQSVLPEVVTERETGYLAVDYVKLVPVLIEAIKELSAKVKELENK